MNFFLSLLLAFGPTVALAALVIGRPYLRTKRKAPELWEEEPADPDRAITERPDPRLPSDLQIITVLADEGEVLLGYRTSLGSGSGRGQATDVSPSTVGTLLLALGRDPDQALSILDGWRQEGVELTLRRPESGDLVVLCERGTAQHLALTQLHAP